MRAFETLTAPPVQDAGGGRGKGKTPKPLARSNENCFRTRVRWPRREAGRVQARPSHVRDMSIGAVPSLRGSVGHAGLWAAAVRVRIARPKGGEGAKGERGRWRS